MKPSVKPSLGRPFSWLAVALAMAGCGAGEPEDIRSWMKESSKDLRARVPDLPKIKPPAVSSYSPGDTAAPFSPDKLTSGSGLAGYAGSATRRVNPDAHPLVRVPLESIRLLGTLRVGNDLVAVMAADRNAVFRVRVGDYIGQGNGRVVAIHPAREDVEAEVLVRETVMENGTWVERDNRVAAPSQGDNK